MKDKAAPKPRKTFKRETAVCMLAFLAGFFIWGVWVETAREAARFLTLPIFTFAGGAFGLDAWAKQVRERAPR